MIMSDESQYEEALRAMKSGVGSAKTKVAFFQLSGRGGAEIDTAEAVVLLEERAKDRDSQAKWMLGLCCEYGIGTEQDIPRAELLYKESSESGNDIGTFLLKNGEGGRGTRMMTVKGL